MKLLIPEKRILISPTAFKDCISSRGLTEFIKSYLWNRGFRNLDSFSGSDGGNGFIDSLSQLYSGEFHQISVPSLIGNGFRKENVFILSDQKTAVIETSSIIGIEQIPNGKRNPFNYNSQPLGFLIVKLRQQYPDLNEFWIGIGGTATIDFGLGFLQGLGFKFRSESGDEIFPTLNNFHKIHSVEEIKTDEIELSFFYDIFTSVSDKDNSFFDMYGPQKGLNKSEIENLKKSFFEILVRFNLDRLITGAGGALGLFPSKYLKTKFIKGTEFFKQNDELINKIQKADLIITGEGKLDRQTVQGKWVSGFFQTEKPVLCICGQMENDFEIPEKWFVEELSKLEPNHEKSIRQVKILIRQILDKNIEE